MKKAEPETLELYRSLIHKAIRRGDSEMTRRAIYCLVREYDFDWLRNRLPVFVFEECWTFNSPALFDLEAHNEDAISDQILALSNVIKNKNAAGLGSLAYNLSQGDESSLDEAGSNALQFISNALHQPQRFWNWATEHVRKDNQKILIDHARIGFTSTDQPWDKSFMLAAAYLAVTGEIPETRFSTSGSLEIFPLWIVIDMHTAKGRAAITAASHKIGVDPGKAMWLVFYFEGALCQEMVPSPWWEQEKIWRLKNLGMTIEGGKKSYERLKPVLMELVKDDADRLREKIFSIV